VYVSHLNRKSNLTLIHALFVLLLLGAFWKAMADEPLPSPNSYTTCSSNGTFCIELVPGSDGRLFRKGPDGKRTNLWSMPGWHRAVFVSDDGHHLVKCYDGLNLIPPNFDPNMSLIEVWRDGALTHRLSVRAVVGDLSTMVRTVSHYLWGDCRGFESVARFALATKTRDPDSPKDRPRLLERKLVLNVQTGELTRTNEVTRF